MYLDALRAIAAVLVLLSHWRALFFLDYSQLGAHKLIFLLPYVVSSAGHQAVIIFFVLSGYLVGSSVLKKVERGDWKWREYLLHRLTRLWIVLVPALLLGGILDFAGLHSHAAPLLYHGHAGNHMVDDVAASLQPEYLVRNFLFLQGTASPTFGSNGPLWSLANEFWYYLLFPCALLALRPSRKWIPRIVSLIVFVAICTLISRSILELFPVWLGGAALARCKPSATIERYRQLILVTYLPAFFFFAKAHSLNPLLSDYLLGLLTLPLVLSLLSYRSAASDSWWTAVSRRSAACSYTLYLVHVPFLVLLAAYTVHDARWVPAGWHLLIGLGALLLALGYAYCIAAVTEFHTDRVRKTIEIRLARLLAPALAEVSE